jgi:hypothetical protein
MIEGERFRMARDLFLAYPALRRDMTAVPASETPLEFCQILLGSQIPEEAVTFCAYLLPKRLGIWWAHECLTQVAELLEEGDQEILRLIRNWIGAPMESRHRQSLYNLPIPKDRTAAGWIALAANWEIEHNGPRPSPTEQASAARAINIGVLAGLARVATGDRPDAIAAFAGLAVQLAELEKPAPSTAYF